MDPNHYKGEILILEKKQVHTKLSFATLFPLHTNLDPRKLLVDRSRVPTWSFRFRCQTIPSGIACCFLKNRSLCFLHLCTFWNVGFLNGDCWTVARGVRGWSFPKAPKPHICICTLNLYLYLYVLVQIDDGTYAKNLLFSCFLHFVMKKPQGYDENVSGPWSPTN